MKNDNVKFTKIEIEKPDEKNFHAVPLVLTKKEYEEFKKYDEDLIAKIIGLTIHSVKPEILENTKGIKIQLIIKC